MPDWEGQSRGTVLGYKIFIFILKYIHIRVAYFLVWFVAFYYYLTVKKKDIRFFFKKILGYHPVKVEFSLFRNFLAFAQILIDKIVILAGFSGKFTYDFEGEEYLHQMADRGKGGIILGAHAGNWEIAGHLLKRLSRPVHVVMYDGERSNIKEILEEITGNRSFHIITIKDHDLSHVFAISEALGRGDLIAMHGDRFLEGSRTQACSFLGKEAKFPLGPYYMASQFNVPMSFVSTMKETHSHYHFYATSPITIFEGKSRERKESIRKAMERYALELETQVKKYPLQWFNFYNFWKI
jgi:predicted LPLAT superfamily acyltransferase